MSEQETMNWLRKQYHDKDADPSQIVNWLLENWNSPEFDSLMLELLDSTEYYDPASSSQGYSQFRTNQKEHRKRLMKDKMLKWVRGVEHVAAILFLPVAVTMFYAGGRNSDVEWLEANTSAGQKMEVLLPDGSCMCLGPSSKLIYPSAFPGSEKKVFVLGSVYADIVKDTEKPFVISSGNIDVVVHGTEFQLNSYENDTEVEVALVDGAVQLRNRIDNREVAMRPGDIVCYDKSSGNFIRKNFAAGYYKDILDDGGFQFVNQRFSDITACLERHFGVTIYIEDESIREERYYASFINDETVDDILNVLNAQNYLKITRKGKIIHISNNN